MTRGSIVTSLTLADERATPKPDERENFCFNGFDPKTNVGFWLHMGRWGKDLSLWREVIHIFGPDEGHVVQRNFGAHRAGAGAFGPCLEIEPLDPGRSLTLRYRGPGRPASTEELMNGPLCEADRIAVSFDLTFTATAPEWQFGADEAEVASGSITPGAARHDAANHGHYEQPGRIQGKIKLGANKIPMDGFAYRDHSRGPRSLAGMLSHCWIQGHFDDGGSFSIFDMLAQQDGVVTNPLAKARICVDGKVYSATCLAAPHLSSAFDPPATYTMQLKSELGVWNIQGRTLRNLPHTSSVAHDMFDGVVRDGYLISHEQPTAFVVDGRPAWGHTERSHRP